MSIAKIPMEYVTYY